MAGLRPDTPVPTTLIVHGKSRVLELQYEDGSSYRLPFELLRVCSPSAEVQGHGPGQQVLQTGKRDVGIERLDPVGNYAVQPVFSDGHDSGIFTWDYLYTLAVGQMAIWQDYLDRLNAAGKSRDDPMSAAAGACGGHSHP